MGIAAATLRKSLGQEFQGEETGRARNHDSPESSGGQSTQLRHFEQAKVRNGET